MEINIGKKAKDKVTGFIGIIVGSADYLYGCKQYLLVPKVKKDGSLDSGRWFDEGRLEIKRVAIKPSQVKSESGRNGAEFNSDAPTNRY